MEILGELGKVGVGEGRRVGGMSWTVELETLMIVRQD